MSKSMESSNLIISPISFFSSFTLALGLQFFLCVSIWHFCGSINNFPEIKKLNLSLISPSPEEIPMIVENNIIVKEENFIEPIIEPTALEIEKVLPEDPFEVPMKMDIPVIPKPVEKKIPKPKPVAKKIEVPKPKVVETVSENIEIKEQLQVPSSMVSKAESSERAVSNAKVILTKSQLDENSKYLTKVMAIFSKNKTYPPEARRQHMEGKIMISFAISKDGRTERVKAKTSQPKLLVTAAEELIKNSKLPKPPKSWLFDYIIEIPISYKLR